MRHAHFLVLTGSLSEYSLYDLLETLRGQQKTGRLLVEFTAGPATFQFNRGALVDARFAELRGAEALTLALSLEDDAVFNFNPLVTPPPADNSRDILTVPSRREGVVNVVRSETPTPPATSLPMPPQGTDAYALLPGGGEMLERLSHIEKQLAAQSRRANVERAVYAAMLVLLILVTFYWRGRDSVGRGAGSAAVVMQDSDARGAAESPQPSPTGHVAQVPHPVEPLEPDAGVVKSPRPSNQPRRPAPTPAPTPAAAPAPPPRPEGQAVQVNLTVEQGRVIRAEVSNPRPGMSAYEALALRIARQRRFPAEFSGQKTLQLKVGR